MPNILKLTENWIKFVKIVDIRMKMKYEYFQKVKVFCDQSIDFSHLLKIICSEECLPDYANKLKTFFTEHLHSDEEIRFVVDGSGYFDVRE